MEHWQCQQGACAWPHNRLGTSACHMCTERRYPRCYYSKPAVLLTLNTAALGLQAPLVNAQIELATLMDGEAWLSTAAQ